MPVFALPVPAPVAEAGRTRHRYRTRLSSEPSDQRGEVGLALESEVWSLKPPPPSLVPALPG